MITLYVRWRLIVSNYSLYNSLLQQQAAATTVYAATAAELEGVTGLYFNNCFYCEESAMARDKNIAHELFAMTLKMVADRVGTDGLQKYLDKYTTTKPLSKEETTDGSEKAATKE